MSLSLDEINMLKTKVLEVLNYVETNKSRIRSEDKKQIHNHLNYTLNTLGNMSNSAIVQASEPCYGSASSSKTIIYNKDGTSRIIDPTNIPRTNDGWEAQFDSSLLMKPPCFQLPPQNITNIKQLKQASEWHRLKAL